MRRALWFVDQWVAAIEEFRDVSANVVPEVESAAWVHIFVSIQIEHEIIEDHEPFAFFNFRNDLLRRVGCESTLLAFNLWGLHVAQRILVTNPAKKIDGDKNSEEEHETLHSKPFARIPF